MRISYLNLKKNLRKVRFFKLPDNTGYNRTKKHSSATPKRDTNFPIFSAFKLLVLAKVLMKKLQRQNQEVYLSNC